jgi:hypothetical protein
MLGVRAEPGLRGTANASLLLRANHLERIAEAAVLLRLHLAEDELTAPADHEVELVTADPRVRRQDPVAAQAVVPQSAALGA